jgi:hypothetical protein
MVLNTNLVFVKGTPRVVTIECRAALSKYGFKFNDQGVITNEPGLVGTYENAQY